MSDKTDVILEALGRLEAGQRELVDRLDGIDTRLDGIDTRLDGIDTRLDKLEARLDRSEAVQIQTRAELMARMDRLQDTMTEMRNDIAVNFGAIDHLRNAHDNTREEVRAVNEMVSLLVKRIRLLEADVRTLKGEP